MRGSLASLVLVLSIGVQETQGQQPETAVLPESPHPWPMYGHDASHSGRTALVGPQTNDVAWRLVRGFYPGNVGASSVPAVAADGTIYIPNLDLLDDALLAVSPQGTVKWAFQGPIGGSPAIGDDGTVYVGSSYTGSGSSNGTIYAINPDGTQRWTFETVGIPGIVTIGPDGTLYVTSRDHPNHRYQVHAIHADGTQRWRFPLSECSGGPDTSCNLGGDPVAVGPDGSVYFHVNGGCIDEWGCTEGFLLALNPDGTLRWRVSTGFSRALAPSACASSVCRGTIYLPITGWDSPRRLTAFRSNGSLKWEYGVPVITAGTSIAPDGTIYLPAGDELHAINPDGTLRWQVSTATALRDRPAVGGDGTIYVNGDYQDVYAFNPDGTLKWLFEATALGGPTTEDTGVGPAGVAIGPDGRLYFGTGAGNSFSYLYALGEPPPGS